MWLFPLARTIFLAAGFAYWTGFVACVQDQYEKERSAIEYSHLTRRARQVRLMQISGICRRNLMDPLTSRSWSGIYCIKSVICFTCWLGTGDYPIYRNSNLTFESKCTCRRISWCPGLCPVPHDSARHGLTG